MPISYNYARKFVGRPIMAYCHDGRRHYGIVQRVTPTSLHLRPIPYQGRPVSGDSDQLETINAEQNNRVSLDISEAGYPGVGYGYGYPGYWAWGAGVVLPLYVLLAISLFWW